jgi:5-methyltetrahydrofolate--homocysteine methyltransferase
MGVYKPDLDAAKGRWDDFWRGRAARPMLLAVVPRPGVKPVEKPAYAAGHDGNFAPVIAQLAGWAETHEFLGEAIPFHYLEFSADHFSTLLGADLTFPGDGGGWPVPFVEDWARTTLAFQRQSAWWRRTVDFAAALRARFGDSLMIASPTLAANLDALAAVRGTDTLLMDLVDQPELVQRALDQVGAAHGEILGALAELLDYPRLGSINRHGLYVRGRINVPQCDFSCMVSGDMFRRFVLPSLRAEMDRFDAVEYHLDGPDALRHLEDLCGIAKLQVVQWVPGAGNDNRDWGWLHDKIDALGKGQLFWAWRPQLAAELTRRYRSRHLVIILTVENRQQFDDCAGALEEIWRQKP